MKLDLKIFHKIAWLNLVLIYVMVLLGAYVKNSGSSLACPDWPLCHGQFLPEMVGGVAIEHSHRLLGSFLGLLTLSLFFIAFKNRSEFPKVWAWSITALLLVLVQATLGGITVLEKISPYVSATHWMTSQLYLANILWLLLLSNSSAKGVVYFRQVPDKVLLYLNIALLFVIIQFLLGALTRHTGAAMACGLGWENSLFCLDDVSGQGVFWPSSLAAKLHMKHRLWGVLSFFVVIASTVPFLKWARKHNARNIRINVVLIHLVLTCQMLLGAKLIGTHLANSSVLLHVLFAMLLWTSLIVLKFRALEMRPRA